MHSRIFQVSAKPIDKCDYIEESNYWDHWFLNRVADYVVDSDDRNEDIEWLSCVRGITVGKDENGEYCVVDSKEEYFKMTFEVFKTTLDVIKDCTLEEFAKGISEMWKLQNAYEDEFGFYVDVNGDLMPFDSFVRRCTTGEKYYIGGTLDYHC